MPRAEPPKKFTALIVAAGSGERLGADLPKAFISLAGRPLFSWSLQAAAAARGVKRLVLAVPPGWESKAKEAWADVGSEIELQVVVGGPSRSHSVKAALELVEGEQLVVVHDAARPLASPELFEAVVERLVSLNCDCVVAAVPLSDTVKEADSEGRVTKTLDRSSLWTVQTPQAFRTRALRDALQKASDDELCSASDDAQLVEHVGGSSAVFESTEQNLKITTGFDLAVAEQLLQ